MVLSAAAVIGVTRLLSYVNVPLWPLLNISAAATLAAVAAVV
jgi:hypothetical protein